MFVNVFSLEIAGKVGAYPSGAHYESAHYGQAPAISERMQVTHSDKHSSLEGKKMVMSVNFCSTRPRG